MSEIPVKLSDNNTSATKKNSGFLEYLKWWKLNPEEVRDQVNNYKSLKITKSFRGIATLLLLGSCLITLITSLIGWFSFDNLYSLILYLPLTFFTYKGKRWSIIAMMILWTLEKALGITASFPSIMIALTWWSLYMRFLYGALRVENERIKEKKNQINTLSNQPSHSTKHINRNISVKNPTLSLIFVIVALILCIGVIGGIYLNHKLQLQRQLQQQEYEKQVQLTKQKEEQKKQQEIYEAESKNYWKQVELNDRLNNIESSLQNQEDEVNNQRNCEVNNGSYMGNGTCVYY